jgi:hypothetical protein
MQLVLVLALATFGLAASAVEAAAARSTTRFRSRLSGRVAMVPRTTRFRPPAGLSGVRGGQRGPRSPSWPP